MRTTGGPSAAHQTLSAEAASVLKHSLTLARRRGHSQVTPLHVAATLLTSRSTLLRRACLHSQPNHPNSHPLQSRALELCFNVALNRLPATPAPLLHTQPSLSNALVAALKRAQAHQRRGCIEHQHQQQQPMLAVKVELDQLVLSILDDPSVSRVMREAGFSSTAVKNNLEDSSNSVSSVFQCYNANTTGGIYSTPNSPPGLENSGYSPNPSSFLQLHNYPFLFSPPQVVKPRSGEVSVVLDVLMRKWKRNCVIVGDTLSLAEGVVSELMGKVERGEVPEELKGVSFIKFQFSSVPLKFMKREEVEMNVADLKRKIESFSNSCSGKVIVYTGDLKWTVDENDEVTSTNNNGGFVVGYNPVDHLVVEIGKMVSWYERLSSVRVWLMGVASYQTYMKCQMKQPSLDVQWSLQAVSVPTSGLGLSLNAPTAATTTSVQDPRFTISQMNPAHVFEKKPFSAKEEEDVLTCCQECKSNYEKEAAFKSKDAENGSSQLPYWLKPQGSPEKDDLVQLRRKYNKLCGTLHQGNHQLNSSPQGYPGKNFFHNSPNWPKMSNIFADPETISFACPPVKPAVQSASSQPQFRRQQSCHIEFSFSNGGSKFRPTEPNLDSLKSMDGKEVKITLALGNSIYADDEPRSKKNVRSELCGLINDNVPWQSETIPFIVEALVDFDTDHKDKFLLIKGNDLIGKRRLARGIAKSMFGSSDLVFCMNMRKNTSSTSQNRELLEKALRTHEDLVVLVEGVDYAEPEFTKFLADCSETGKLERDSGSAVFILTVDGGHTSCNKASENMDSVIQMKLVVTESTFCSVMPNFDNKRKADWDSPSRTKARRSNEMEEVSSKASGNESRELARQLSSHSLDLNIKADDDEPKSDLTLELSLEDQNPVRFLDKIKNCFVFNSHTDQDELAREMFLSKLKTTFQEANASQSTVNLDVEEGVLEDIFRSSGLYLNSLFDQWLKDVFQTSLRMIGMERRDKVRSIRVGLEGGKGEHCAKDGGYMGTCLPKRIKVSSFVG